MFITFAAQWPAAAGRHSRRHEADFTLRAADKPQPQKGFSVRRRCGAGWGGGVVLCGQRRGRGGRRGPRARTSSGWAALPLRRWLLSLSPSGGQVFRQLRQPALGIGVLGGRGGGLANACN